MRVLMVHSYYLQRGGEDAVVDAELALLTSHGHDVRTHFTSNEQMGAMNPLSAGMTTIWSSENHAAVQRLIKDWRPDVMHVHNTFQSLSPSVLWAAASAGVPVVQTLHNFRLLCPQAMLLRNDQVCEDCVGHVPWRGVVRACYRQSRMQSAALTSMLMVHRWIGTYARHVTRFIALSEFSRRKLIEGGLPAEKIVVKPNFVEVEHTPTECERARGLFVGRLSREKGVEVLLRAAQQHGLTDVDIVGDGEAYRDEVRQVFGTAFQGFKPLEQVMRSMSQAAFLILPSICYENFPRSIAEAFACATPVIASNMGAMAEIVQDGYTGLLFKPGDARDLATKVAWAQANPGVMREMGRNAHREYHTRYRAQVNHDALLDIYRAAIRAVSAH